MVLPDLKADTSSAAGQPIKDNFHIFPGISGVLISLKTNKKLGILPPTAFISHKNNTGQTVLNDKKYQGNR